MVDTNRKPVGLMILSDQGEHWALVPTLKLQPEPARIHHLDENEYAVLPKLLVVYIKITFQVSVPLAQACGKEYFNLPHLPTYTYIYHQL
jgi:hypothetical protein